MSEIVRPMRCAVYTRKSTSEGLEQDFNSLDAQREACMAFIASQRGEGWTAVNEHYDDGGFTGANTDRPGLKQLISDIKRGKINCVVVYKVDRLSRSLLDFSRLLEFFDKYDVSFVSVTQNFNTKTSMGRLTLNILLSFAQFEREIISERTRDKMAASRMKGKFVGGFVPFGYRLDKEKHRLVPHPETADEVRFIFESLLQERSVAKVLTLLSARGIGLRERKCKNGVVLTAKPISRTHLYNMVHNPLYMGKVLYKGKMYEGEHEGLISEETFNAVQEMLRNSWKSHGFARNRVEGVLRGLLYCGKCGSPMVPTYGKKNGRKHFYYICQKCQKEGYQKCPTRTVRQKEFDEAVLARLIERGLVNEEKFKELDIEDKNTELRKIVRQIIYEYKTENIEVALTNGVNFSFHAKVKPHSGGISNKERQGGQKPMPAKLDKETYYKTLALQIREYMRVNALTQKQCAQALGLSQARVSQLLRVCRS